MCGESNDRCCRRLHSPGPGRGRVQKKRPLVLGSHSNDCQRNAEEPTEPPLPESSVSSESRIFRSRKPPSRCSATQLGHHSIAGVQGSKRPDDPPAPVYSKSSGGRIFRRRDEPLRNMTACVEEEMKGREIGHTSYSGGDGEESMQRGYAERRQEFTENEERRKLERGVCGHGCLSVGKQDHLACNRNKMCSHYKRGCLLKAKCCGKFYPCRKCHDEVEDHAIDRYETEFLLCKACGAEDVPFGEFCSNCHVQFAKYSCMICKFFDDSDEAKVYHCHDCGICRVGAGLGIDNVHCKKCNTCVPIEVADTHPCTENALKRDCPVCMKDMATSSEQIVFMKCGHAIHMHCFSEYTRTSYTCPICSKALTDMTAWYRALDITISQEKLPPGLANRRRIVYCNDCEVHSKAKFHLKYHKCGVCSGYNTRVVREAEDESSCQPEKKKDSEDGDDACRLVQEKHNITSTLDAVLEDQTHLHSPKNVARAGCSISRSQPPEEARS